MYLVIFLALLPSTSFHVTLLALLSYFLALLALLLASGLRMHQNHNTQSTQQRAQQSTQQAPFSTRGRAECLHGGPPSDVAHLALLVLAPHQGQLVVLGILDGVPVVATFCSRTSPMTAGHNSARGSTRAPSARFRRLCSQMEFSRSRLNRVSMTARGCA